MSKEAPPMSRLRKRRGNILIGVLVAAAVAVGAVAAVVVPRYFQATMNGPHWVSDRTDFYVALTPNLQTLASLPMLKRFVDAAGTLPSAPPAPEGDAPPPEAAPPQSLEAQAEAALGITFEDDVLPWLGLEAAIAVEGFERHLHAETPETASPMTFVMLAASRDDQKARAFLEKLRQRRGPGSAESHEGVELHVADQGAYADALSEGYVFLSNDARALKEVLARRKNRQGALADVEAFKRVRSKLSSSALGYAYMNGQVLAEVCESSLQQQPAPNRASLEGIVRNAEAFQGGGLAFSLVSDGIEVQTAGYFDAGKLSPDYAEFLQKMRKPVDPAVLGAVSGEALAFSTFSVPAVYRDALVDALNNSPEARQMSRSLAAETGFDLQRDFLDWFTGDTSLVLMPGENATTPISGYMVFRPDDAAAAQKGIDRLSDALGQSLGQSGMALRKRDTLAFVQPAQGGQAVFGYGFERGNLLIGFGQRTLEKAGQGEKAAITADATFRHVMTRLPEQNGGLFYLDVDRAQRAYRASLGTLAERRAFDENAAVVTLRPVRAIAAAATPGIDEQGMAVAELFIDAGEAGGP